MFRKKIESKSKVRFTANHDFYLVSLSVEYHKTQVLHVPNVTNIKHYKSLFTLDMDFVTYQLDYVFVNSSLQ